MPRHPVYRVRELIRGQDLVGDVEDGVERITVYDVDEVVVVRENRSVCPAGVTRYPFVTRPFPEFRNEVDVGDVVAVVLEATSTSFSTFSSSTSR